MWRKKKFFAPLVEMHIGAAYIENSMELAWKIKKTELLYDLTLPGIYPKEINIGYQKYICTPRFIAALFTTAKIRKQPRCSSTDKWIKKM